MSRRAKALPGPAKAPNLSAEDQAFLDFIARLAVDQALREANAGSAAEACGADPAEGESKVHADA